MLKRIKEFKRCKNKTTLLNFQHKYTFERSVIMTMIYFVYGCYAGNILIRW